MAQPKSKSYISLQLNIEVYMKEDISKLQIENYVMLIRTGYNNVTLLSISTQRLLKINNITSL
jgi:hypothetical protein